MQETNIAYMKTKQNDQNTKIIKIKNSMYVCDGRLTHFKRKLLNWKSDEIYKELVK